MQKNIQYWDKVDYYSHKSEPKGEPTQLKGETEDEIFELFYRANNKLRYCNGSYYKFVEPKDEADYMKWLKSLPEQRSFNLYYGNGVVD